MKIKIPDKKFCSKCKFLTPIDDFYRQNDRKSGRRSACKACCDKERRGDLGRRRKYAREWARQNPDKVKNYKLIKEFGITLEQYNDIFREQQGCCAICDKHQSELKLSLAVDHNHASGNIRQLLCNHCNLILGLVKDSIPLLKEFIKYVEKHKDI